MTITTYADQIWIKSGCRQFEAQTLSYLKSRISKNTKTLITLVDAVPNNYKNYEIVITDNILKGDYINLSPEFWGSFSYCPEYQNTIPTKLFNCFIHRTGFLRQTWFYELYRRGLLNYGAVSFLLDYRENAGYDKNWNTVEEKQKLFQWIFDKGLDKFLPEHEILKNQVPYRNFDKDLDQTVVDTKISLVLETYYDREAIAFSEKVFRALQLPRPMLLFSGIGSVNILKNLGFDLYDDLVDHNYDYIENPIKRQLKILSILENFKTFEYSDEVLLDFEKRAEKNRNILFELKQNWPARLEKVTQQIEMLTGK
jgi:hypothetical protein